MFSFEEPHGAQATGEAARAAMSAASLVFLGGSLKDLSKAPQSYVNRSSLRRDRKTLAVKNYAPLATR